MNNFKKFYIIGAAGSGKTTLANIIAKFNGFRVHNLDNIFWVNSAKYYGIKRDETERTLLFDSILDSDSWIIEGCYTKWILKGIKKADVIIFLDISKRVLIKRIIQRYIKRKLGVEKVIKKETLNGIIKLIKWNNNQIQEINDLLNSIKHKNIVLIKSNKDIEELKFALTTAST